VNAGPVSGLLLAAGASRRYGQTKQLLPYAGGPLLRTALLAALHSSLAEVILVLGCRAADIEKALNLSELDEHLFDRLKVVVCEDWERGMSASLQAGLANVASESTAIAVTLGDQPGVNAEMIDVVLDAFASSERPLVRPVFTVGTETPRSTVPGHPVLIARSLWPEIADLNGDEGARGILTLHADTLLEVSMPGEPPADVDIPEDFVRLL
jgi:molybdenum cofactor cytidylyltransferase